jgi:hypothetical protein
MMRAGVCLLTVAVAGAGCSSKSSTPTDGGGMGGGGGGSASTCGKNTVSGCTSMNTDKAPASGVIADFATGDGGLAIAGGLLTYGGTAAPTYLLNPGSVDIMEAAGTSPTGPLYAGFVLFFNNCVDACAFKGVSFTIKGTISAGCTMQFSSNFSQDVCNDGTTSTDPKGSYRFDAGGTCPAYSPQLNLTGISSTPKTIQVAFDDAMLVGGVPQTMVDNAYITGVQWQFTLPQAGDGGPDNCQAAINLSDVKFY